MSQKSKIEWTDATWNPVRGCTIVSPGCKNRYADPRISSPYRTKFDTDDIAATVCRTVVRRVNSGDFDFDNENGFWFLLRRIAKRKISNKVRWFNTHCRS